MPTNALPSEDLLEDLAERWTENWSYTQRLLGTTVEPTEKLMGSMMVFLETMREELGDSPDHVPLMMLAIRKANTHSRGSIDTAVNLIIKRDARARRRGPMRLWIAGTIVWACAVVGWYQVFGHRSYEPGDAWLIILIPPGLAALSWLLFGWARRP